MHSSAVEHGIADPGVAGSIPAAPLSFCFAGYVFPAGVGEVFPVFADVGHWSSGMILL